MYIQRCHSFQGVRIEGFAVFSLYTELEVFSFHGVRIKRFCCIQRCPHFKREIKVYIGVPISVYWNRISSGITFT